MTTLLHHYFQGNLSDEEKRRLLEELEADPALKARFVEMWHARLREAMQPADGDDAIAREGLTRLRQMKRRRDMRRKYIVLSRYAAAVLVAAAMGIGAIVWHTNHTPALEMAEAVAPTGRQMELQLSDGTKVWLAPRSRLVYPVEFPRKGERSVELSGEALFDAVDDARRPFEVHSGDFTVRALGTTFRTSTHNGMFETVLVAGIVEVLNGARRGDSVTLQPGQRAWADAEGRLQSESVDTDAELAPQSGLYEFDNVALGKIAARLATWHDVTIDVVDPTLAEQRFSAKFRDGDDIETILRALQRTGGFDFSRDDRGVISIRKR